MRLDTIERHVYNGEVLDKSGNWVPLDAALHTEQEMLRRLENGTIPVNGKWVSLEKDLVKEIGRTPASKSFRPATAPRRAGEEMMDEETRLMNKESPARAAEQRVGEGKQLAPKSDTVMVEIDTELEDPEGKPIPVAKQTPLPRTSASQDTSAPAPSRPGENQATGAGKQTADAAEFDEWEQAHSSEKRMKRIIAALVAGGAVAAWLIYTFVR